jgi:hypothetical protein
MALYMVITQYLPTALSQALYKCGSEPARYRSKPTANHKLKTIKSLPLVATLALLFLIGSVDANELLFILADITFKNQDFQCEGFFGTFDDLGPVPYEHYYLARSGTTSYPAALCKSRDGSLARLRERGAGLHGQYGP